MEIPLEKRLRKRLHVEIGRLQDEVVEAAYALDSGLVFHGGTAIWRCFNGNRFSEDIDLYCPKPEKMADGLEAALSSRALSLVKFKRTENLIFSKISNGEAEVRLEINLSAKKKGVAMRYERINGSSMDVLCLSADELFCEKISAYENRRFVRDIYDIYHLSGMVEPEGGNAKLIAELLTGFKPPVDERNLPALIYAGAVPSVDQMLLSLKRRFG